MLPMQYLDVPRRGWTILSPFRNSRKKEAMRYFGAQMLPHSLTREQLLALT